MRNRIRLHMRKRERKRPKIQMDPLPKCHRIPRAHLRLEVYLQESGSLSLEFRPITMLIPLSVAQYQERNKHFGVNLAISVASVDRERQSAQACLRRALG
jgi:hypothetical protein